MSHLYIKCKVNPEDEDFVEKFQSLHPDFTNDFFLDKKITLYSLFKYIVLTFDVESPYVIKYSDWAQRRRLTAKECGFPMKGMHYLPEAESIILGKKQSTNRIILRYCFLQNDIDFIKHFSYQNMLYTQLKMVMDESIEKPADYDKLKKNIDDLTHELRGLENAIFHGDESKLLRSALYDFTARISLDIRPEDRADKIEEGEEVVDDVPYTNYEKKKMTFADDE